jgi:hypothetical protein
MNVASVNCERVSLCTFSLARVLPFGVLWGSQQQAHGFSKSFWANGVPVDFPFQFGGPVTALTARHVQYGAGTRLARPSPQV